jgi:exodeoxyribonuclease V alpha subunit
MQHREELSGIVEQIIFHNVENGFTIFVLQTAPQHTTTIKAHITTLHEGEHVTVQGSWITHPKFGKQFQAEQCTTALPTSTVGIQKYLASGMIKGIGPVYAERLVKAFGAGALDIIDKQPYRLHEVNGIGAKRVERIIAAWQDQKEISQVMVFLQEKNISPAYATKIYKKYGSRSIAVVQENPYRLADEIWGIGFKIADQIAKSLGFAAECAPRLRAGILYTLSTATNGGHLYTEVEQLKATTISLLELATSEIIAATMKSVLHALYESDRIKVITYENVHYIALSTHYHCEQGIATKTQRLLTEKSIRSFDIQRLYTQLRTSTATIALTEDQQRGIITCLQHKITIITGGPGTGKTTLIKQLLGILEQEKVRYKLAAPTGRAAKRITESTQRAAATLHRLLEFDVASMSFKHNEQNALPLEMLIVDEASMIDVFLAHALLKALPYHAHLVLIGDVDQLPSVGPGNVLHDLIASGRIPTIRLTTIFRQLHHSMIVVNAHRVNHGEFPTTALADARRDFYYLKEQDPAQIPAQLQTIYHHMLAQHDINAARAIVLTPMNRGTVGTIALNSTLQQLLNPTAPKELRHGATLFRMGDRVMQIKNNYDTLVFNGDMGMVEDIDTIEHRITVQFPDTTVTYETADLDELVLAYAISIHKSQGSEFDAVIIPLFTQHFTLLQRNLLYTAITRAKRLCIIVGQAKAIAIAINNNKGRERRTFLQQFLTTKLVCRS